MAKPLPTPTMPPPPMPITFSAQPSLRDYFAAAALQGLLANGAMKVVNVDEISEDAYLYADAMLEERIKTP